MTPSAGTGVTARRPHAGPEDDTTTGVLQLSDACCSAGVGRLMHSSVSPPQRDLPVRGWLAQPALFPSMRHSPPHTRCTPSNHWKQCVTADRCRRHARPIGCLLSTSGAYLWCKFPWFNTNACMSSWKPPGNSRGPHGAGGFPHPALPAGGGGGGGGGRRGRWGHSGAAAGQGRPGACCAVRSDAPTAYSCAKLCLVIS